MVYSELIPMLRYYSTIYIQYLEFVRWKYSIYDENDTPPPWMKMLYKISQNMDTVCVLGYKWEKWWLQVTSLGNNPSME